MSHCKPCFLHGLGYSYMIMITLQGNSIIKRFNTIIPETILAGLYKWWYITYVCNYVSKCMCDVCVNVCTCVCVHVHVYLCVFTAHITTCSYIMTSMSLSKPAP